MLEGDGKAPPLGMMFRVWNYVAYEKKEFLGTVTVSRDEMLDPPKGRRAFELKEDARMNRLSKSNCEISGFLFLKIGVAKTNKKGVPTSWRVDIVKCTGLYSCDVLGKSNPIVEVFWRGPAMRDDELEVMSSWANLGFLGPKEKTIDPAFGREDRNLYELPPRWTDYDASGRGVLGEALVGGCWCAKNQLPDDDPASVTMKGSVLDQINKRLVDEHAHAIEESQRAGHREDAAALESLTATIDEGNAEAAAEAAALLAADPYKHEVAKKIIDFKLEVKQLQLDAEERERRVMYAEERLRKQYVYEHRMIECKPYKMTNMFFNMQFSRMKQFINEVPAVLDRLVFQMGEDLDGGGKRFRCHDPTTGLIMQVTLVPLLFPEDEEALYNQMQSLIGRVHMNLMRVYEFSTHYLRNFNMTGYTALNERVAIVISEYVVGIPMLMHMKDNFDKITNDDFRIFLMEMAGGIDFLHSNGLLHRNIHPDYCVLELPVVEQEDDDDMQDERLTRLKKGKFKYTRIRPVVGDYWFLHNPRAPGCTYSEGRADWGFPATAPPEVKGGHKLTDKSDVYAFGVLAYYWATRGEYPNMETTTLDGLKTKLPLKWGDWLHALLRMCLQRNPRNRATAHEVFMHLSTLKPKKLAVFDRVWNAGIIDRGNYPIEHSAIIYSDDEEDQNENIDGDEDDEKEIE